MYKIDLHTHSEASPDGSLRLKDYQKMLTHGRLNYVAITDHNTIGFARQAHAQLGEYIIVGEEVLTVQGEIIGLFLKKAVPSGLSIQEAIKCIHDQDGIVYVPHPFEAVRSSLSEQTLQLITDQVEIMEVFNGRRALIQNRSSAANAWAVRHNTPVAASSDAHGLRGWGRTYTLVEEPPTRENLCRILCGAELATRTVGARGRLYPKLNRLRKKRHHVE